MGKKAIGALVAILVSVVILTLSRLPDASPSPFFDASSPWNTPIPPGATVDPASGAMVQSLVSAASSQGFLTAAKNWTVPLYHADSSTPRTSVSLTASWAPAHVMSGVPIPSNVAPDPSGDGHLAIVDNSSGCEYDFWKAVHNPDGSWSAGWANAISTTGTGIFPKGLSARGSGFALGAGLILPSEMATGVISHALVFSYNYTKAGGPVAPATESDGRTTSSGAIPEGARVRLDPTLDVNSLGLSSWQKTIAKALQQYGMILGDTGGGITLYAQNSQSSATGYPWGDQTYAHLPNSLVSHMQVMTLPAQFSPSIDLVPTSCASFS